MPAITMLIGVMLFLVGLGGYGFGVAEASKTGVKASWTALIPAIFGLIIMICGFVATNEKPRKHAMHAALVVALLGLLAVLGRLIPSLVGGNLKIGAAFASQTITAVLCAALIAFGVASFARARRNRV